jgi:hypothetical protein
MASTMASVGKAPLHARSQSVQVPLWRGNEDPDFLGRHALPPSLIDRFHDVIIRHPGVHYLVTIDKSGFAGAESYVRTTWGRASVHVVTDDR